MQSLSSSICARLCLRYVELPFIIYCTVYNLLEISRSIGQIHPLAAAILSPIPTGTAIFRLSLCPSTSVGLTYSQEVLWSEFDLIKHYEVSLSQMLQEILET